MSDWYFWIGCYYNWKYLDSEAQYYFQLAFNRNHSITLCRLVFNYYYGDGVEENRVESHILFLLSSKNMDSKCTEEVANDFEQGIFDLEKRKSEAKRLNSLFTEIKHSESEYFYC